MNKDMSYNYHNFIIRGQKYHLSGTTSPDKTYLTKDCVDEIMNDKDKSTFRVSRGKMYEMFLLGKVEPYGNHIDYEKSEARSKNKRPR